MNRKRVSIKDIAQAAGVSHPTVSRALRGKGRMSSATRARILQIAEEMGYTPSLVARGLVTQRTESVGLVVADIADPFYSEIIKGVEQVTQANGFSLFLGSAIDDADQEVRMVRSFLGRHVDGLIVSSSQVGNGYQPILEDVGTPLVLINTHVDGSQFHSIYHQDFQGSQQMLQHLIRQGRRRIAYLGNRSAGRAQTERKRAWQTTLGQEGLPAKVTLDCPNSHIQSGFATLPRLLEQAQRIWGEAPDAIVAYNDLVAIGAMKALQRQGLRVPEDVAVMGFDDIEVAAFTSPTLSTWRQPRYEMGVRAAEVLLDLLREEDGRREDGEEPPREIAFSGELVLRESA